MQQKTFLHFSIILVLFFFTYFTSCQQKSEISEIIIEAQNSWGGVEVEDESMIGGVNDFIYSTQKELVVLDPLLHQVTFFNDKGDLIRKIGKRGQGPSEFLEPQTLAQVEDTLIIYDVSNNRLQYFDLKGDYLKSIIPKRHIFYRPIKFNYS